MTTVEPAAMGDLDRLVDLWQALAAGQREHGSLLDPAGNEDAVRESLGQHVLSEGVLVARRDGEDAADSGGSTGEQGAGAGEDEIVGFVMFGPEDAGFERERDRGVIRNVYVVPEARDEGVGTALMDAAEDALAAAGATAVVLETMADNEAARRFYRRRGYEPHRVRLAKPLESDTHTS